MLDPKKIEEVVQGIANALPPGLTAMQADVEKNIKTALSGMFAKLDLVTREEFDVQTQVLQRTREKITALEQQVAEMSEPQSKDT